MAVRLHQSARFYAICALSDIIYRGKQTDEVMPALLAALPNDADKRFLHTLVYGVLRHYFSLEADISRFTREKPEPTVAMALMLGAYQLRHLATPAHAAVAETVNAIRPLQARAVPLVNAILRQLTRKNPPKKLKPHQRCELPRWMYCQWRDDWGAATLNDFVTVLQSPPPLTLAILGDREAWLTLAYDAGFDAVAGELSATAVLLPTGTAVTRLPWYDEGHIIVMDQAAQASVHLLCDGLQQTPNHVIDLCSSPGGKTALLAYLLPQSTIFSVEYYARRLPTLQQNLQRLQLANVHIIQGDARQLPWIDQSADAIFLDAPCSASGLLRKHPDVRFHHNQQQLQTLVAQQTSMLQEAIRLLKPNALMVYAVCSIHHQEQAVVQQCAATLAKEMRLLPAEDHDGFYAARMQR